MTEVDWSVGAKQITDTGINGLVTDHNSPIESMYIDGVKSQYTNYQQNMKDQHYTKKHMFFPVLMKK